MQANFQNSPPPLLLHDVIEDRDAVIALLERNAPYNPLGGWFSPGVDQSKRTAAMWFQKDWMHADLCVDGAELFLGNDALLAAIGRYYDAAIIEPHTLYVNLMTGIAECGPAHTDNPYFRGVDRTNAPMMFLRAMLWSGLFTRWAAESATSIWWLDEVEGGGFRYWPDGPDAPPQRHVEGMANTALVGDNHGMFHQVEPVGTEPTRRVTPRAELVPAGGDTWSVCDLGEEVLRVPLSEIRVSVLMKAYVYPSAEAREESRHDRLDVPQAVEIFNRDLAERGFAERLDAEALATPGHLDVFPAAYPEAVPQGAGRSIYDALREAS
jgi:hypothetical protein